MGDNRPPSERHLPAEVVVLPDTPVERAWERFHVFEALHHRMDIMNPLSSADLDQVVSALDATDGDRVLDIACGHGELLLRLADAAAIEGVGIDLSPWQIARAAARSRRRAMRGSLSWWLGKAEDLPAEPEWDIVLCVGASWIWDGFAGTAQAVVHRTRPGGMIALGDLQRRPDTDPARVPDYEDALTVDEQRRTLQDYGVTPLAEIAGSSGAWEDYQRRIEESAAAYRALYPGPQAEQFYADQAKWAADHVGDEKLMAFTVWVGRIGEPGR